MNPLLFILLVLNATNVLAADDYDWQKVEIQKSHQVLRLTGRVIPQDGALSILSARTQGRVLATLKREGEKITVGTELYEVSSPECVSMIEERRVAEQRGMKDILLAIQRRETQLAIHATEDRCFLTANFSGVLIKRNLELGSVFNLGDALATIVDIKKVTVELEVPEKEISNISLNDHVFVHLGGDSEKAVDGVVDVIVPSIDVGTRTSKIRLKGLQFKQPISLEHLVTADVELKTQMQNVFLVEQTALVFHKNKQYLIKKGPNGPVSIVVNVINDFDGKTFVVPEKPEDLKADDFIMAKDAIFIFNTISNREVSGESLP